MNDVFSDTGYWIAIMRPEEDLNEVATSVANRLRNSRIVTTEMVFVEVLAYVSKRGAFWRKIGSVLIRAVKQDPRIEVVPQTSELFDNAMSFFDSRPDQRWSLVDCASFFVMQQRGITEALAYDRDFEQAGFVALLRHPDRA